jgi:hypothetical protein
MRTASWACIACGHAVAAPPTNIMNSGRPNVRPKGLERHSKGGFWLWKGAGWFGHTKLARLPRVTVGTAVASRPPVQIPACAANAPGSCLGFWRRSGDKAAGVSF